MIKRTTIILIYICLTACAGCGKKAPPKPPGRVSPNPPRDLSYNLREDGLLLTFRLPEKNSDGTRFSDYSGFEVYKMFTEVADSPCLDCVDGYKMIYKGNADSKNGKVSYLDRKVRKGQSLYYRFRVYGIKGAGDFSAPVQVFVE